MNSIKIGAMHNADPGKPRDGYVSALEDEIIILRAANAQLRAELARRRAVDVEMSRIFAEAKPHLDALRAAEIAREAQNSEYLP